MSSSKFKEIARTIRDEIIDGRLKPGERLPHFPALEARFKVTRATLNKAIRLLRREGFLDSVPRSHVFVSRAAPHATRYAVVMPYSSVLFREALVAATERIAAERNCLFRWFEKVAVLSHDTHPEHLRLVDEASGDRLAGVIMQGSLDDLEILKHVARSRPPVVRLAPDPAPGFPCVDLDHKMLLKLALDRLADMGARRLAVLGHLSPEGEHYIRRRSTSLGVEAPPLWRLAPTTGDMVLPRKLTELLLDLPRNKRPDGILVTDDMVLDPVLAGIRRSGLKPGRDVAVVSHCNWPRRLPSPKDVVLVGYDSYVFVTECLNTIDRTRAGKPVSNMVRVPARFADG